MPFCMNCGQNFPVGAKFCMECGTPLGSIPNSGSDRVKYSNSATAQYEALFKCPNCGSSIGKLDAVCPYCGAQVVNRKASSSVQMFADELDRIEAEATEDEPKGLIGNYASAFGLGKAFEKTYGNKTFNRKISLISAFPIPNTVEEISEFILLAVANIDVRFGKKSVRNSLYGHVGNWDYCDITLAKTWINKLEQAYHKAELSFSTHPIFPKIKSIYESKMKELNRL